MTVKALFHAVLGVLALSAQASAVAMHSPRGFPGMHGSGHLGKHTHVRPKANQHSSTITFSNPKTKEFHVDGTSIPDVDFDVGDSWAGLMPISGAKNEQRKLFFWFWPSNDPKHTDDLVFWTNGGPGCSSLEGLLQENGPFKWYVCALRTYGFFIENPVYAALPLGPWELRSQFQISGRGRIFWVEQPLGTGFSTGTADISDDDELAAEFAGFLVQFLEVFSELKGKNFYLTGESYAGFYVPYIANFLYEHPGLVPLQTKGIWVTDPLLSWDIVNEYIPAYNFAQKWKDVLALNSTFMADLRSKSDACGFTDYYHTYATYPPKGPLPLPSKGYKPGTIPNWANITDECKLWEAIYNAAVDVNPNFNVYRIFDVWPVLWDVLGFPGSNANIQSPLYFARKEVQDAIHAPHIDWVECSSNPSYVNGKDNSVPSMLSVMPNVIQKSARTLVLHGLIDYEVIAEGTRIAIQNMTWGGKQGFQTPIVEESFSIQGFGILGNVHQERVTYVEVNLSGHMLPSYSPWTAYKTLWYLLGRGELNSPAIDASLYPNNFELFGSQNSRTKPRGGRRQRG